MTSISNGETGASVRAKLNTMFTENARDVLDVDALLDDATLTYTVGQPGTISADDYVRTRREGFAYQVAESGATDQHLTTAGGVKLTVVPIWAGANGGIWLFAAFGPTADGATNNIALFEKAVDAIHAAGGGSLFIPAVDVDAGEYFRIDRPIDLKPGVYIEGTGPASLIFNDRATGTGSFGDHAVINPGNYHPAYYDALPWATLNNVSAGDRTVTLAAGSFTAGVYPANSTIVMRGGNSFASAGFDVYEWQRLNRIESSDPATGTITLRYAIDDDVTAPEVSLADGQVNSGRIGYSDGSTRQCFVAYKSGLRNLGIRSNSLWVADSATLDCLFENLWLDTRRGLYGNSFCHTAFRNIHAKVKECALEWSCNSHDSYIDGYFVDSDYAIPTTVAFATFGENGANCHLRNFTFKADNWDSTNVMLRFAFTQRCSFSDGVIYSQTHQGVGVQFESTANNTPCEFNVARKIKFIGGSDGSSAVSFGSTGYVKWNAIEDCEWAGESTARHGYVRGEGNAIRRTKFSNPTARLDMTNAGAVSCEVVDCDLTAGYTLINGSEYQKHKLRGNQTAGSKNAKAALVYSFSRDSVSSTTSGNVYKSMTLPAGTTNGGDRIRVSVRGRLSSGSTTAAKELRLVDDSVTYASLTFAVGESGTFEFDATIVVDASTTLVGYTKTEKNGAFGVTRTTATGLSLTSNARTFSVQGWTGSASETILFDQCEMWVEKPGGLVTR